MTTAQIQSAERHVAEKVMGWRFHWNLTYENAESWRPCSDPAQAAILRERAVSTGYCITLIGDKATPGWLCEVLTTCKLRSGDKQFVWSAFALTKSEASTIALARATGWRIERGKHKWCKRPNYDWPFCFVCGIVKRADGKNKPCRGPVRITLRASKRQEREHRGK